MRRIELTDIEFHAFHGVGEEERKQGGRFLVTVNMAVDFSAAEESDLLEDTLDYGAVYGVVKEEMAVPSKLIEHVAGRIMRRLRNEFRQIQTIEVIVEKTAPPVEGMKGGARVAISG